MKTKERLPDNFVAILYYDSCTIGKIQFLLQHSDKKIILKPSDFRKPDNGTLDCRKFNDGNFEWVFVGSLPETERDKYSEIAEKKKHLAIKCADGISKVYIIKPLKEKLDKLLYEN